MTNNDRLTELFNLWSQAFGKYHNSALVLTTNNDILKKEKADCEAAEIKYLAFRKSCIAGKSNGGLDLNDKYSNTAISRM